MTSASILGPEAARLGRDEAAFFRDADPWGFILFARNVESPVQLRRLTAELRDAVGREAPILIDQEGGRVQRMRPPHWHAYLPALDQMRRASDPLRAQWLRHRLIAAELHEVGIDVNCAPLADLVEPQTHHILRNRLYGDTVDGVVAAACAAAEGLLAGGVLPVLKHIPGYGRASVDSHKALPRVSVPLEELRDRDFAPFAALNDMAMGMTAHIVLDAVDPERPATTSATAMRMIREEIGFDGLVMTDDLSMEALSGEIDARAAASIAAGCDVVLHCNGDRDEMEAVVAACGAMGAEAIRRAEAALAQRRAPDAADLEALRDELGALTGEDA
ncbi:MAG: glycoside hydrolase family 3 N-terminal domain-containing protein [Limimaricola soesokkakensis]|uniref:glycoside hydrolase family 3 N-terminal domain-containing protein n=1 Tax=Limimaricola soesokkakensis TaxID=1343159 RepID=UPI004058CBF6